MNGASDHVGTAGESHAPRSVTQDGDARRARTLVGLAERSANRRSDFEHVEEIDVHHRAVEAFGVIAVGQDERDAFEAGHAGKSAVPHAPVEEVRRGPGAKHLLRLPIGLGHEQELFSAGKRKRPQQDRVHDAENRGVRADADRHGQRGDDGEARRLPQRPNGVPQVLSEHG